MPDTLDPRKIHQSSSRRKGSPSYDSADEVSTLLYNDGRDSQEGSCQRNLRT